MVLGGAGALAIVVAIARPGIAAPRVERASLTIDTVQQGDMTIDVNAPGTLVPEHVRILAALTAGRVELLPLDPGAAVSPGTVIVKLANPDVELQLMQGEQQQRSAMSALASLKTALRQQRLTQEGTVADMQSQYQEALRNVTVVEALGKQRLASVNEMATARDKSVSLRTRTETERARLTEMTSAEREQVVLMESQIAKLREIVQSQRARVESMIVRAGEGGQLQSLPLELGQWVNPGMELARIAEPGRLKAMLHVPESQAADILPGLPASIDTRNGIVAGHVLRSNPASQNGSVTVEVALDGGLPAGTRSDLSVDGTIQITRLAKVLHIARPPYGSAGGSIALYRLSADGRSAERVMVRMGRASSSAVQIVSGLRAGDRVIVSDVSVIGNAEKIQVR